MERMKVENDTKVKKVNNENQKLYQLLSKHSGWPMKSPGDVANLYATLRAEVINYFKRKIHQIIKQLSFELEIK